VIGTWRLACAFSLALLLLGGVAPQGAAAREPEPRALVQVLWHDVPTRREVEAAGLPAYARLTGDTGPYLLAEATYDEVAALRAEGAGVRLLDGDTALDTYYLAYPLPGQFTPRWNAYGQVVLDEGNQVLLSATPPQAHRLVASDAASQALELVPRQVRLYPVGASQPNTLWPDPRVVAMMDQVRPATLRQYVGDLSGAWPAEVGGRVYTLRTRYTYSGTPVREAVAYAGERLAQLGLDVEYHTWQAGRPPNVVAQLPGAANAERIVILCAHLDSITYDDPAKLAPGADDNASGVAAVLVAAEILSAYEWGCTLRFALWTGEEQGLLGSQAYAFRSRFSAPREEIHGVLNLDTIAWNTPDSPRDVGLHATERVAGSVAVAQRFADVVDTYGLDLIAGVKPNGAGNSDHAAFWSYNYPAIMVAEDLDDWNPSYHSNADVLDSIDMAYYTEIVRASVATFAHMGCLARGGIEGRVTDAITGVPLTASVRMTGTLGMVYETTADAAGYYTQTVLPDTYEVRASAPGYAPATATGVVVGQGPVAHTIRLVPAAAAGSQSVGLCLVYPTTRDDLPPAPACATLSALVSWCIGEEMAWSTRYA
jgi:hypothetical protein